MKQISKLVSELNHLNAQFCEFIDCNKAEASTLCPHHCLKGKKFKKIVTYLPGYQIQHTKFYLSSVIDTFQNQFQVILKQPREVLERLVNSKTMKTVFSRVNQPLTQCAVPLTILVVYYRVAVTWIVIAIIIWNV